MVRLPTSVILLVVACTSQLVVAQWPDERVAGPFLLHADFSLAEQESLSRDLSEIQRHLRQELALGAPQERIHVFLFSQERTQKRYLKRYFPGVPYRRALYLKARGPGMVFAHRGKEFATDVRHETTHALLHAVLPMVPLWLDEGLAEYFEMAPRQRANGHPHLATTRWEIRLRRTKSIAELEKIRDLSKMGTSEYRQAWAWVHFMLQGPEPARRELIQFLRDIGAAKPPGSLDRRLRNQIPNLEKKFAHHFQQRKWRASNAVR